MPAFPSPPSSFVSLARDVLELFLDFLDIVAARILSFSKAAAMASLTLCHVLRAFFRLGDPFFTSDAPRS